MEGDANQMSQATLCRSGCGFYGNPASDGLCSKCYKDALKRKQSTPPLAAAASGRGSPSGSSASESSTPELTSSMTTTTATTTVPVTTMTNTSLCQDTEQETSEKSPTELGSDGASACSETMDTDSSQDMLDLSLRDQKKKKNRCLMCRKKVGLTGFECRCGGLFCSLHRYSDKHSCTFDYKELGAQEIRKNNPIVVGEKIQKI